MRTDFLYDFSCFGVVIWDRESFDGMVFLLHRRFKGGKLSRPQDVEEDVHGLHEVKEGAAQKQEISPEQNSEPVTEIPNEGTQEDTQQTANISTDGYELVQVFHPSCPLWFNQHPISSISIHYDYLL